MAGKQDSRIAELPSAARQLGYALEESPDLDGAFERLYAGADERARETYQALERLVRPDGQRAPERSTPFAPVRWALGLAPSPGRAAAPVFQEYHRQESFGAGGATLIFSDFAGFLSYLAIVLGILLVVSSLYAVAILPQFRSLYDGFGAELPGLTRLVFGGGSVFVVLLIACLVLIALMGVFVHSLRRALLHYAPAARWLEPLPLLGHVVRSYHQYLWTARARLLLATGLPPADALELAASAAPVDAGTGTALARDLAAAARLGRLEPELKFQHDAASEAFVRALARCRRRTRIVLTILTYTLAAVFVAAMYQPIFSLGSNI